VVTIGAPPEPDAVVLVPAVAAVAPAAARVSAASAAQQTAASRARRQWVVFMILTLSISPERERKSR
jgi:nitrate reductase NapE component